MTPDQRRAIEWDISSLIILYANLNDEKRWADVVALYVEDGEMFRPIAPDKPIVGRAAILASFLSRPAEKRTKHICANVVVSVLSDTRATAYSSYLIYSGVPEGDHPLPLLDRQPPIVCEFHDRLVLSAEGWRFACRRGAVLFRTA